MRQNAPKHQRDFARNLRSNMTQAETRLWQAIRKRQLGVKFRRQVPIGPYIADFLSYDAHLVIEVDGGHHAQSSDQDKARTAQILNLGFRTIRFWNNDIIDNLEGVLMTLRTAIDKAARR